MIGDHYTLSFGAKKQVIYLDGYDEFGNGRGQLLDLLGIRQNSAIALAPSTKFIITCREGAISDLEFRDAFFISGAHHLTEVVYISPISDSQLTSHLRALIPAIGKSLSKQMTQEKVKLPPPDKIYQLISESAVLSAIAREALFLRIIVATVPSMLISLQQSLTRLELVKLFCEKWIEEQICQLSSAEQQTLAEGISGNTDYDDIASYVEDCTAWTLKIILFLWQKGSLATHKITDEQIKAMAIQLKKKT